MKWSPVWRNKLALTDPVPDGTLKPTNSNSTPEGNARPWPYALAGLSPVPTISIVITELRASPQRWTRTSPRDGSEQDIITNTL